MSLRVQNSPSIDAAYSGTATNSNSTSGGHIDISMKNCFPKNCNASNLRWQSEPDSSATQQALSDYADTLTVVAAGQF